jgi:molybdate transport system regulatory protein
MPGGPIVATQPNPFCIRSKIWIEDDQGHVVFGLGRYRILETVRQTGSMHAAAKALKMSYRSVWMRIRASEQRIGKPLVVREGNGSRLTSFGEKLMAGFERLQQRVKDESDSVFDSLMSEHLK